MNISSYLFGGQHLFESNCWSSESMKQAGRCNSDILVPKIQHPINVWTSVANMLTEAFEWARNMEGMYTVVGVECGTGTQIPTGENLTEWYQGTLDRIQKTYNATHFWLWTNEAWTARRNDTHTSPETPESLYKRVRKLLPNVSFDLDPCKKCSEDSNSQSNRKAFNRS